MPHRDTAIIVVRSLLLLGSAFYTIGSILALRAGRKGWGGVLAWALSIPVYIGWGYVSPRLHISEPGHHASHDFRLVFAGAIVTYGIIYVAPFLSRESKEIKAARKRAAEVSHEDQTP
jgi:uncharacterized membrane protein HdeD (DUF308 family)